MTSDHNRIPASTYRFFHRLVDYAGTFPPAKLPLPDAFQMMLRHRLSRQSWMLGRFVLTLPEAMALPKVSEARDLALGHILSALPQKVREQMVTVGRGLSSNQRVGLVRRVRSAVRRLDSMPFRIALIASAAPEAAAAADGLRRDLAGIADFHAMQADPSLVDILELRLPADLARRAEAAPVTEFLREAHRILETESPAPIRLFVESTTGEHHAEVHEALVAGIAEHLRHAEHTRTAPVGFKLRTGGTEAAAFPPADVVARAIAAAARAGVAMKATAGLHHPVRHHDEATGAMMHGFLNVFGAAVLAHARGLPAKELEPIVAEEDGGAFSFPEEAFAWRGQRASAEEVDRARRAFATSFGCCDFSDPVKGLRDLGMLP
jgi:hypothetical protein